MEKQWGRVSVSRNIFNAICVEDLVFEAAVLFKFRRWKGSAWKHELCFSCSASFMERKMRFYARINRAGLDAYDKVANYR